MENYNIIDLQEATPLFDYYTDQRAKFYEETSDSTEPNDIGELHLKYALSEIIIDTQNANVKSIKQEPKILAWYAGSPNDPFKIDPIIQNTYFVSFPYTGDSQLFKYHPNEFKMSRVKIYVNPKDKTIGVIVIDTDSRKETIQLKAIRALSDLFFNLNAMKESIVKWNKFIINELAKLN